MKHGWGQPSSTKKKKKNVTEYFSVNKSDHKGPETNEQPKPAIKKLWPTAGNWIRMPLKTDQLLEIDNRSKNGSQPKSDETVQIWKSQNGQPASK